MLHKSFRALFLMLGLCTAVSAFAQAGGTGAWINVPYVAQQKDGCGAAVIAMLMQYWDHQQGIVETPSARPEGILHALYSDSGHGIYASAMVRYFQENGFRAFAFAGNWQDFAHELQKGRPLIVALRPDTSESLHYVVVAGVDTEQHVVLLNDPARRKLLKEERSVFEQEWKATHNWALLVLPESTSR